MARQMLRAAYVYCSLYAVWMIATPVCSDDRAFESAMIKSIARDASVEATDWGKKRSTAQAPTTGDLKVPFLMEAKSDNARVFEFWVHVKYSPGGQN